MLGVFFMFRGRLKHISYASLAVFSGIISKKRDDSRQGCQLKLMIFIGFIPKLATLPVQLISVTVCIQAVCEGLVPFKSL